MASFYIDSKHGNDANSGRSPSEAWKTFSRLADAPPISDGQILLAGGRIFQGPLTMKGNARIEIMSYGEGRAEIHAGAGDGIRAEDVEDLKIAGLKLVGAGRKEGSDQGRGVHLIGVKKGTVDDVEVSGFQRAGVDLRHCEDIRVTRVHAHNNGHAGISAHGSRKLYIARCRTINNPGDPTVKDNHSGNGIVISAEDALIEYCESAENGWDQFVGGQGNGPVGIWCHDSKRVTIQYNVAHHNKSTSGDGGGFDFDGGTSDSVLQYNYSYENQSSGMLLWEYGSRQPLTRNVVRYNVFVHDGEAGIRFGKSGGQDVTDIEIYHNLVISKDVPCVLGQLGGVSNVNVRNNILIGSGQAPLVRDEGGVRYEGNCYWNPEGEFRVGDFKTLEEWARATGQETVGGKIVGIFADPKLASAPGTVARVPDLEDVSKLKAYSLLPDSPLIDRGMDLKAVFSIDPGYHDFFRNRSVRGRAPDIGPNEAR